MLEGRNKERPSTVGEALEQADAQVLYPVLSLGSVILCSGSFE